jgi:hypothetical protein
MHTNTKRKRGADTLPLAIEIPPLNPEQLDAVARVFGRLAVEKALKEQGLDSGPAKCEDASNPHKAAHDGAINTAGA